MRPNAGELELRFDVSTSSSRNRNPSTNNPSTDQKFLLSLYTSVTQSGTFEFVKRVRSNTSPVNFGDQPRSMWYKSLGKTCEMTDGIEVCGYESTWSLPVKFRTKPPPPGGLELDLSSSFSSNRTVDMTWTSLGSVYVWRYQIRSKRIEQSDVEWNTIRNHPSDGRVIISPPFTTPPLLCGATYEFQIASSVDLSSQYATGEWGLWSESQTILITQCPLAPAPSNFVARGFSENVIDLSWTFEEDSGVSNYKVQWWKADTSTVHEHEIQPHTGPNQITRFTNFECNTRYYFQISAKRGGGQDYNSTDWGTPAGDDTYTLACLTPGETLDQWQKFEVYVNFANDVIGTGLVRTTWTPVDSYEQGVRHMAFTSHQLEAEFASGECSHDNYAACRVITYRGRFEEGKASELITKNGNNWIPLTFPRWIKSDHPEYSDVDNYPDVSDPPSWGGIINAPDSQPPMLATDSIVVGYTVHVVTRYSDDSIPIAVPSTGAYLLRSGLGRRQ